MPVIIAIMEDGSRDAALFLGLFILAALAVPFLFVGLIFQKTRRLSLRLLVTMFGAYLLLQIVGAVVGTSGAKKRSPRTRCMSNLSQLGVAMRMYAMDHDGVFPASFVSLTNYMDNPKLYVCPSSGTKVGPIQTADQWGDYVLVSNLTERSASEYVHAYCKPGNHRDSKGINVLFVDMSVNWMQESQFGTLTCDVLKGSRINN